MTGSSPPETRTHPGPASAEETIADTQDGAGRSPVAPTLEPGAQVGRYRVLELVGRGAMGVVYAAYDPDLDRKVALKVIALPIEADARTEQAQSRLLREAQALAQLSHPNVVVVHDVGRWEGRLFLAMEFVEGQTLTQWLQQSPRDWRAVLDVFIAAGRGLAAAHAAELVHRDFKPDNVMVGHDDRVRVMDFGLVRGDLSIERSQLGNEGIGRTDSLASGDVLAESSSDARLTREGDLQGTPAYMSPEQHRRGGVDARSDQFSFCVALFEGLYGVRPFVGDTVVALAVSTCEHDPRERPEDTQVPAWIDEVVRRGLAKDPAARFPTMDALLARLLRDPTRRRRWLALGGAVVSIAALGLGGVALHAQGVRIGCERAGASIAEVWSPAEGDRIQQALTDGGEPRAADAWTRARPRVETYADAWQTLRTEVCMHTEVEGTWTPDQLARASECLDERRSRLDALLDVVEHADRDVAFRVVTMAAALPALEPCADPAALARRSPLPEGPIDRARLVVQQRRLQRASILLESGEHEAAQRLAMRARAGAQAADHEPLVLEAEMMLGLIAKTRDANDDAQRHLEAAYFGAERLGMDALSARAATAMIGLAGTRRADHEAGLQWARHAEGALERLGDSDELAWATLWSARSVLNAERAAYPEALADQERALAIRRATVGDDHLLVADSLMRLGSVYFSMGDQTHAFEVLEDVRRIRETVLGPEHPQVAEVLNNLGVARSAAGDHAQARALLERSLAIRRAAFGNVHSTVANTLVSLADLAFSQRDAEPSIALNREALAIREQVFGPEHPMVAQSLNNLGAALSLAGRHDESAEAYARAYEIVERILGPTHPNTLLVRWGLGRSRISQGRADEGRRILDGVRATLREQGASPAVVAAHDADYAQRVVPTDEADRAALRRLAEASVGPLHDAGPDYANDLKNVQAWLQAQPPPEPSSP